MTWIGSVQCPNCEAPLDSDTSVCPYCYSSAPHSAPWKAHPVGEWWWGYVPVFAALGLFTLALVSDMWFGTNWIAQLLELIQSGKT